MTYTLHLETQIPAAPEVAFDLSLSIDLHLQSMRHSHERAVAGVTSGQIGLGETVTWKARHFALPWTMTTRISALERPVTFVDEQVSGPFAHYRHTHSFIADGNGTRMVDDVGFAAPLGVLGTVVERLVLARKLQSLLEQRNATIAAAVAPDPAR